MSIYTRIPPDTDAQLPPWALNLSQKINATPAAFFVPEETAAEYETLRLEYVARLADAHDPIKQGPMATSLKNLAKNQLLVLSRSLAATIGGNVEITDIQRQELGLRIRKPPTPGQAPTDQPDLDRLAIGPTSMRIRVHTGETNTRRRIARGAMGAMVWSYVGALPPVDYRDWKWEGNFTRPIVTIDFPLDIQPGTKVWVSACWYNRHGRGPASEPMDARLSGMTLTQVLQQENGGMTMQAA